MDRNLSAALRTKRFADCVAERQDMWEWERYAEPVERVVAAVCAAIRKRGRIYFFGNGGSAAQAQHFAAELSGRFLIDRKPWAGLALSVDTSALTAIANDYGFDHVFARQLEASVQPGDVAIGLTTSGKSANVIAALQLARAQRATGVAFTGNGGGPVVQHADIVLIGPDGPSWKVQEVHLALGHIVCELVELALAGS